MKTIALISTALLMGLALKPIHTYKSNTAQSTMTVAGTSTLHDWEIKAETFTGVIKVDEFTDSLSIETLTLTVPVKSLKSGKSAMDNNTHKALKANQHANINYTFTKVLAQEKVSSDELKLTTIGKLTVAGHTESLRIPLRAKFNKNKGIVLSGSVDLSMKDFGVEPPTFMFGTVTTGDKITVHFNIQYN